MPAHLAGILVVGDLGAGRSRVVKALNFLAGSLVNGFIAVG